MIPTAAVERTAIHDEMSTLQKISHMPLGIAAVLVLLLVFYQYKSLDSNWNRRGEFAGLILCVALFIAAIATSLVMHNDMADNGHVEQRLGTAEYVIVAVAIVSFAVLVFLKYRFGHVWEWSDQKPTWGMWCYIFLGLFLVTLGITTAHFFKGNSHWRKHKKTEAHRQMRLSREFEIYNMWHMQFHVYAGHTAIFIVLLYWALYLNDLKPAGRT